MSSTQIASISVHKFIDNVGAYVGFGSIIAVALLVLLYFAHARETATLRDRLDEAHARIGGLEQRIAQLMQSQRGRGPAPAAPVAVPGAATAVAQPVQAPPTGNLIPSVRRLPPVTTANGLAPTVAPPPPLVAGLGAMAPAAAIGMAGPALASATKMIPVASPGTPASEETMFVAPSTNGAGENGASAAEEAPATSVAAAVASNPTASPRRAVPAPSAGAPAGPPRVQIGGEGSSRSRRTAPGSRPLLDDLGPANGDRRRISGRLMPLLIGGAAVIVIIVGLIVITNTGGGTSTGVVNHPGNSATGASVTNRKKTKPAAPFVAARYTVSVLNGTAVGGLAANVGSVITKQKFKLGNVSNAANQTQTQTFVYYVSGAATASNRTAAQHVATTLKLAANRVRSAGPAVLQSCATSPTGASLGRCKANVIVSVGQDRADLATSSTG